MVQILYLPGQRQGVGWGLSRIWMAAVPMDGDKRHSPRTGTRTSREN